MNRFVQNLVFLLMIMAAIPEAFSDASRQEQTGVPSGVVSQKSTEEIRAIVNSMSDEQRQRVRNAIGKGLSDRLEREVQRMGLTPAEAKRAVAQMMAAGDGASDSVVAQSFIQGVEEVRADPERFSGGLSSMDDWLNSDLPLPADPSLGQASFVDSRAGDTEDTAVYIDSPDVVLVDSGNTQNASVDAEAAATTDIASLTSAGWQVVRAPSGAPVAQCSTENCTHHIAYLRSPDGGDYSVNVSRHQAGALMALEEASSQTLGPTPELSAWMESGSHRDRMLAAQMVSEFVPDSEIASQVTASFEVSFGSSEFSNLASGATQQEVDYVAALTMGDTQTALNARMDLIDATAQQYVDSGVSTDNARTMATAYVNSAIDRPMFTGVDHSGYLTRMLTEFPDIEPGELTLSPSMVAAFDQTYLDNGSFIPRLEGLQTVTNTNSDYLLNQPDIPSSFELSNRVTASPGVEMFTGGIEAGAMPRPVSSGFSMVNTDSTGGMIPSGGVPDFSGGIQDWMASIKLPKTDMMYVSIERLFGGPVTTIYNAVYDESTGSMRQQQGSFEAQGQPTAITFVLSSVLFFVLIFASAIMTYTIIYGAYRSAQDGQMFGKDWNTFWVPARSVIHTVLVLPIPVLSGLSGAQALMLVFAMFGTAVASTVGYFAFYTLMTQPVVQPNLVQDDQLVAAMAKGHACVELLKRGDFFPEGEQPSHSPYQVVVSADGKVTQDGNQPNNGGATPDNSFFGRVKAFFSLSSSGGSDPLEGDASGDEQKKAVGKLYKTTGINPYQYAIRRLKFGPSGECGVIYVPEFQQLALDDIDKTVLRYAGINREFDRINGSTDSDEQRDARGINEFNDELADGGFATMERQVSSASKAWLTEMKRTRVTSIRSALHTLNLQVRQAVLDYLDGQEIQVNGETRTAPKLQVGPFAATLTSASEKFFKTLADDMQRSMRNVEDPSAAQATQVVRQLGWMSLGTFYWTLESRQVKIAELFDFSNLATYERNGVDFNGNGDIEQFQADYESISNLIDRSVGPVGVRLAKQALDQAADGMTPDTGSIGQGITSLATGLLLVNPWGADIDNLNISPIEQVRHMGVTVTNSAIILKLYLATAQSIAEGAKHSMVPVVTAGGGTLSSLIGSLTELLSGLMEPALIGAFIAANIIPAMPYVFMMIAAMGYLIYVIEAVVGVNFWSMMSAHPDGHDIWGKGGTGYPIMLTLLIRPLFIVLGFVVGIGFNWVMGHWINVTVVPSNTIQNAGTSTIGLGNLSQVGGLIAIYTGLHFYACWKSFGLSWELPNAILRWMGVQDHQDLGEREGKETLMAVGSSGGRALSAGARLPKSNKDKPQDPKGKGGSGDGGGGSTTGGDSTPTVDVPTETDQGAQSDAGASAGRSSG